MAHAADSSPYTAAIEGELARAHEALAALRQSQALLLSTLDAASNGILTLQYSDNAFFYNIRFVELWGIPEDKLSDMDVQALADFQLTRVKDPQGWLQRAQHCLDNPDEEHRCVVELKDSRALECHVLPQRIAGRCVGSVVTFRDITEQRRHEQEIRRARDMAEEATRMKSELLANMSHEIRSPMNAIIGLSDLVLKTGLAPRQRDYIQKVRASGQYLLGIVDDILDFSKVEAGKLDLANEDFQLEQLLGHTASLVSEKCHAKGLELVFDVAPDVPGRLVGDSLRLGQILLNYANNAVKFTRKGEVLVSVRASERTERDVLLHFRVRDTGIGLTGEQQGRLFQSFTEGDASANRKFGGTGLGLAICKRLAALMGGEVGVESGYGSGSTFWFSARLGIGQAAGRELLPSPDLRGRRALVVDDNEHARASIAAMLQAMTFTTAESADGAAAVDAVRRAAGEGRPYDIVYMDWRMPGMDGIEAARQIRALGLKLPPLLLMVPAYGEETLEKAAQDGITSVLTKPVSPSLLFDATMSAMGAARHPGTQDLDVYLRRQIPPCRTAPSPAAQYPRVDLPEDIAGLDTALGLANMAGKTGLYMAILRRYVDGQREIGSQMRRALGRGNRATAHKLAHALNGLSANIGAVHVQQQAAVLEEAIRGGEPLEALQMRLVELELPLHGLIESLEAQLGSASGPAPDDHDSPSQLDLLGCK
ncbi:ATP-binding protein [Caenimonas soli]|uniref:ATP-binding protein n=1 Tax=Caenimonas soli TaxID=2735555 RepID=UPI001554ED13|nr:ATP-binding protein [Caenimonas soli]NPC56618.1 response regulator [Caenimonas soli]